jgi:CspA family cold shock protein
MATAQSADTPLAPPDGRVTSGVEWELSTYRVTGHIDWFDAAAGYGMVTSDDGGADISLHVTALRASGYLTAKDGAGIECEVLRRPKVPQVLRILAMDETTALAEPRTPRPLQIKDVSSWEVAQVKWFNRVRRFGFLSRGEGTPDIFVHLDMVQPSGLAVLRPGTLVQVCSGRGVKGTMAAELRPHASPGYVASL